MKNVWIALTLGVVFGVCANADIIINPYSETNVAGGTLFTAEIVNNSTLAASVSEIDVKVVGVNSSFTDKIGGLSNVLLAPGTDSISLPLSTILIEGVQLSSLSQVTYSLVYSIVNGTNQTNSDTGTSTASAVLTAAATPEPASVLLFASGATLFLAARRRKSTTTTN